MKTKNAIHNLIFLTYLLIIISSCRNSNENNPLVKSHQIYKVEDILGAWGDDYSTGNADFGVYHDSIYYPDPNLWYKYTLKKDTIFLFRENNIVEKILIKSITKDSMTLEYLNYNVNGSYRRRQLNNLNLNGNNQ
jgi:hypothetical protein